MCHSSSEQEKNKNNEGEGDYEYLRKNNTLPSIGQKLKIPGVDFLVEVTELKDSASVVDGADQPVTTITFKGPNPTRRKSEHCWPSIFQSSVVLLKGLRLLYLETV